MNILVPVTFTAALLASSAAFAQTSPSTDRPTPVVPPAATVPQATAPAEPATTMTEQQAKAWINKSVYSSDDKNVGSVAAIQRDSNGKLTEVHADMGGFLGLGSHRVMLTPAQVRFAGDRVVLDLTSEQVKDLPKIAK